MKHDYDEGGAENELAFIFTRLGTPVDRPDPGGSTNRRTTSAG